MRECFESVLSQTYTSFEVVVVDDQSTDETMDIINSYAKKDPRIRVFRNEHNLGLVQNWNHCIELARGEWIKFVFQDDLLASTCVKTMLSVASPKDLMVVCNRSFIFDAIPIAYKKAFLKYVDICQLDKLFPTTTRISPERVCELLYSHIGINFIGEPTAVMLNRDAFIKFGNFNPHFIQLCDFEYWARVGNQYGFVYVPEALATFRLHSDGTTQRNLNNFAYRMGMLESLILLHEFTYQDVFAPLRSTAFHQRPSVDFSKLFVTNRWLAYYFACCKADDSENPTPEYLIEFRKMVKDFPRIGDFRRYQLLEWKYRFKNVLSMPKKAKTARAPRKGVSIS